MEYVFTLKYHIGALDPDVAVERIGEAGCDDALAGTGQAGRVALEFTREASDACAAMLSALADVKQALPEARLIEAAPDLVGLTDVANLIGVTRQNMRKLMLGHGASFPAPLHEGSASVWHLADILEWLKGKGSYVLDKQLVELAESARQINLAKEARQLSPELRTEIEALLN